MSTPRDHLNSPQYLNMCLNLKKNDQAIKNQNALISISNQQY